MPHWQKIVSTNLLSPVTNTPKSAPAAAAASLPTPAATFAIMMGDHQHDEDMMGDQPQQDEDEASTPATMRQSKIVKEIMGKVFAEKSSINYTRQNSTFALFVYEKNEELRGHLLESWFVERLSAFATLTEKKRNMCKNVSWHAARRTITVLLYCQISHSPILVIFSQREPGVEEKIKAGQIRWGFPRTIWQRVHSFIFIG